MKTSLLPLSFAAVAAALVGCEWGGVHSGESWNDAYSWANFSGTYKLVNSVSTGGDSSNSTNGGTSGGSSSSGGTSGGSSSSSSSSSGSGGSSSSSSTEDVTRIVTSRLTYRKNQTNYQTNLPNLIAGTVTVSLGQSFKDDGAGVLVYQGSGSHAGTVDYATGSIILNVGASTATSWDGMAFSVSAKQASGAKKLASSGKLVNFAKDAYSSNTSSSTRNNGDGTITTTTTTTTTSSNPTNTTTSVSSSSVTTSYITWLNVTQKGNLLTIKDNYGTTYSGRITGASCPTADEGGYINAAHIRFPFEATCTANPRITLSGSFSGDWSGGSSATSGTLANRAIDATYHTGKAAAQFQAVSGSVAISAQEIAPYAGTTEIPPYSSSTK